MKATDVVLPKLASITPLFLWVVQLLRDFACRRREVSKMRSCILPWTHDISLPNKVVPCGCRQPLARQTHRVCLFSGLPHNSTYYAMIALNRDRANNGVSTDLIMLGLYEGGSAAHSLLEGVGCLPCLKRKTDFTSTCLLCSYIANGYVQSLINSCLIIKPYK